MVYIKFVQYALDQRCTMTYVLGDNSSSVFYGWKRQILRLKGSIGWAPLRRGPHLLFITCFSTVQGP